MDIKVKTKKVGGWEKDKWENYIRNKSETYKEKKNSHSDESRKGEM